MQTADIITLRAASGWIAIGLAAAIGAAFLPAWLVLAACVVIVLTAVTCRYAFSAKQGWLPIFFFVLLLMPPVPLPAGDTGPHPSILIAALGVLIGIARLPEWGGRSPSVGSALSWGAVDSSLLLLLFALVLSVGFAAIYSDTTIALASAVRVMLFAIGLYVYFAASRGPDRQDRASAARLTRWLFWIGTGAALFGCIDFLFHLPAPAGFEPQMIWVDSGVYRRAQGLFYESSTLGNFCVFFLVFIAVSFAGSRERRIVSNVTLCIAAVLLASALLLSFSRSSVLAAMVAFTVLALVERRRWYKRREVWVMLALAVFAVVAFASAVPEIAGGYWGRLTIAFDNLTQAPDRALSGRLESWSVIARFIGDHPWQAFGGIGYKTLPYTEYLGRPVVADNMYLSLLVETGALGLAALLLLNFAILTVCWRALRRGSFHGKWLFCFWVAESMQMLTGDILTYWRVSPVYFWVLARAVLESREPDPCARESPSLRSGSVENLAHASPPAGSIR